MNFMSPQEEKKANEVPRDGLYRSLSPTSFLGSLTRLVTPTLKTRLMRDLVQGKTSTVGFPINAFAAWSTSRFQQG